MKITFEISPRILTIWLRGTASLEAKHISIADLAIIYKDLAEEISKNEQPTEDSGQPA